MAQTRSQTTPELRLYNTLARENQVFAPIDPQNVRMYVCGPTVYDFAHIGNARPVIVFDVLYRLLRHLYPGSGTASDGSRVTYVRNITDVDDKIIDRARRDFPALDLNTAIAKVTSETADQFHADVTALGCLAPTHEPRATEFVLPRSDGRADMVTTIQTLLDKGHAYVARGREGFEVLFDVSTMPDYGKLSNRNLDEQVAGARVEVEAHKRSPADFVLWKESCGDEPGWAATFATSDGATEIYGRPGWHIECSAMSAAYLGEVFDIHGGGIDLAFPHHENEIAQSRCAHGTDVMANVWMHNGFLQVEGRKMSKSLGNFVTIHELLHTDKFGGRQWPGEVLRLAMLMTHYREPIDWTVDRLEEAEAKVSRWRSIVGNHMPIDFRIPPSAELVGLLRDDLRTSDCIQMISSKENVASVMSTEAHQFGADLAAMGIFPWSVGQNYLDTPQEAALKQLGDAIEKGKEANRSLFKMLMAAKIGIRTPEVDDAITARLEARKSKDWAEADRIRDELAAKGILLKDGKDPETGEPVTTWEPAR